MKRRGSTVFLQLATAILFVLRRTAEGQCDDVQLVTREEWNARPPVHTTPLRLPVNMTFIHHSAGSRCYTLQQCSGIIRAIQNYHMDANGWDDIGYSFLVGEDGRVYEGRGWSTLPAHSPRYNFISHGICIMGNFMKVAPLSDALKAVEAWIQCGLDKRHIISGYELFGHRDGRCTDCPGDVLYGIIQTWPHYSHRHIPVICKGRDLGILFVLSLLAISFQLTSAERS